MKDRWLNLLFFLLTALIVVLFWQLFAFAKGTAAATVIINLLKVLSVLLFLLLSMLLFRNLFKLYLERKRNTPGFRLKTRLVVAILPLTLVPCLILFTLSSRFIDASLYNILDPNVAGIIRASQDINRDYLDELGDYHLRHAPVLLDMLAEGQSEAIAGYLESYGLHGVTWFRNGVREAQILGSAFPADSLGKLAQSLRTHDENGITRFEDGSLIARFSYVRDRHQLDLLYYNQTAFTERYTFLSESYAYLEHAESEMATMQGLNVGLLLIVTLAVIFGGVWTSLAFARRFLAAFNDLIAAAHEVSGGNLDARVNPRSGDELDDVMNAFNKMTATLKSNQAELQQKALDLENLNDELAGQIQYNQTMLQQINAGIVTLDLQNRVETSNPAALRILDLDTLAVGAHLHSALDEHRHSPLLEQLNKFANSQYNALFGQLELLTRAQNRTLHVAASLVPLRQEDGIRFGTLLVLEDLTLLLNAQKLAAWQEVAKRVAHEIKNPLTPIQLSIQRIHRKASKGSADLNQAIASAYDTVMSETTLLKNLVNEFSTFAKLPEPVKSDTDLTSLAKTVVDGYCDVSDGVPVIADLPAAPCVARCDASQIHQVLTNLIQNARRAAADSDNAVEVGLRCEDTAIHLWVADQGIGIPESERNNVFLPYYSKAPKGTGLGLAIVKRIIEDHGGQITIEANQPQGVVFQIHLPLK